MYLTLFLIVICILYVEWKEKKYKCGIFAAILFTGGIFSSCQFLNVGYNYAVRGEVTTHSKDNRFLATLTLLSILLKVTIVSAVIFCQSRYTIYNMPLFYISGLLLANVWRWHKRGEKY